MSSSTARLGLGIVGGIVGAYFGMPQLGFMAGSLLGAALFPQAVPDVEGPRLDDLSVSSSANGNPIALGGGTMRMPAEIIDATEIEEERRESEIGGKGGMSGGGTQVTYRYYGNLFCSFGEPLKRSIKGGTALAIIKVFADGKLVYDNSAVNLDVSNAAFPGVTSKGGTGTDGFTYRFYPGNESQLPDPFFENLHGVGNVPAYRGQVCLAIERWPLENHGNRIPTITAVIAYRGSIDNELRTETSLEARTAGGNYLGVNWDLQRAYSSQDGSDAISEIDLTTLTELRRSEPITAFGRPAGEGVMSNQGLSVAPLSGLMAGALASVGPGFGTNATAIGSFDPLTLECNGRLGADGANNNNVAPTAVAPLGNIAADGPGLVLNDLIRADGGFNTYGLKGSQRKIFICRIFPSPLINAQTPSVGAMEWVWGGSVTENIGKRHPTQEGDFSAQCRGKIELGLCEFIMVTEHNSLWPAAVYKITVLESAVYRIDNGNYSGVIIEVINSDLQFANGSADVCTAIMYDQTDESHILFIDENPTSGKQLRIIKIDNDGGVVWDRTHPNHFPPIPDTANGNEVTGITQSRIVSSQVCIKSRDPVTVDGLYTLDTVTGDVTDVDTTDNALIAADILSYDSVTGSMLGGAGAGINQLFCGRVTGLGITLGEINRNIADRAGYDTSTTTDVDFTALDTVEIPGIGIKRVMQALAAVRPLLPAYAYEIVEVDHKLQGLFIDKASALTIDGDDIIPQGREIKQLVLQERVDDQQISSRVNLIYADPSLDYEKGNQPAKRIRDPRPSSRSISERVVNVPVAETASKAYEIAENMLWRSYIERTKLNWQNAWDFLRLAPSDVVTLTVEGGVYTARIIEMNIGADFTIRFKAVSHASPVFTPGSDSLITDGGTHVAQTLIASAVSTLSFLDTAPLLRDRDDADLTVPVYYGCFATPEFNNSTIYKQDPAGAWHDIDRCLREIVRGFTLEPLPAPALGAFFTDEDSSFEFQVVEGGTDLITSQTPAQFRDNGLVFLVGSEVIGVRDVTQQTDGSFLATGLHRGLLGTEGFIDTHADAETVFLLDSSVLMVVQEPSGTIGVSANYKAVNDGQSFELAPTVAHAPSSTPKLAYAVADLAAVNNSGDIDITWSPRSRLTSNLRDGIEAYTESEPTLSYEIDILDGSTVVRTLSATTESVTYGAAQQTTDFGGSAGEITINAYKLHTAVGRGRVASLAHTGEGSVVAARPSTVGSVTEYAKSSSTLNEETFNVTPAAGNGTTMLVLYIAYSSVTASGPADDVRFLDFQGGSYVRFGGTDMNIVDAHPIMDTTTGNFTALGNVFYLLNPGTTQQAIEVKFPESLAPNTFIMSAFTVQDVNPAVPISTPRSWDTRLLPLAGTDQPAWPSTVNYFFSDESHQFTAWLKDFAGDTLGLAFQTFHDDRKGVDLNVDPGAAVVGFGTSTGGTSGNTAACGYRCMSAPLSGDIGDIVTMGYMHEEFNTTQPRQGIAINIEVNGL